MTTPHIPVLLDAVLDSLLPEGTTPDRVIDGTLGAGGHAKALLDAGAKHLIGLDVDPIALQIAQKSLDDYVDRVTLVHASYTEMTDIAKQYGWESVDAILLDLGVSSMQVDTNTRGFSFREDGPLDMRFDPSGDRPPASELVNYYDEGELADLFFQYGEERLSRRIAQAVVANRPYETTRQLADVIANAVPAKVRHQQKIHPATRVFQALRIAVNDELNAIERTLPRAVDLLKSGGRLGVISFHSLEDRIVKRYFKDASTEIVSPPGMVLEEKQAQVKLVTRKPIVADESEVEQNPRSRSAKLRIIEKL